MLTIPGTELLAIVVFIIIVATVAAAIIVFVGRINNSAGMNDLPKARRKVERDKRIDSELHKQ